MKKLITLLTLTLVLLMAIPVEATNIPILTKENSKMLKARICRMTKENDLTVFKVIVTENGRWKNHIYDFDLTQRDFINWVKDEGKVKVGQKVYLLLYKNNTKKVNDDIFINIHKRA